MNGYIEIVLCFGRMRDMQLDPLCDRAAQLAPFAALTGYEAAVGETARQTTERRELDAQDAAELNRRLTDLAARLKDRPEVTIEYFVPDERKAGGAYVTVTDVVRNISIAERIVALVNGDVIPINDIAVAYVVRQGSRFVKLLHGSLRTVR